MPQQHDDTWEWTGTRWTLRVPAQRPGARAGGAIAFDEARQRTLLMGGVDDQRTWAWDGSNWSVVNLASPTETQFGAMAYDRRRDRTVFFTGGYGPDYPAVTWELSDMTWTNVMADPGPLGRGSFNMVYADHLEAVLVFGGAGVTGGEFRIHDDLWSWDGQTWRERL
jgi:hypothetical protein